MTEIVLTEEQASQLRAGGSLVVRDMQGTIWASFRPDPLTPEFLAELKRRAASPGPLYTSAQVFARLAALEAEQQRLGRRLTPGETEALIAEWRVRDPGHFRPAGEVA